MFCRKYSNSNKRRGKGRRRDKMKKNSENQWKPAKKDKSGETTVPEEWHGVAVPCGMAIPPWHGRASPHARRSLGFLFKAGLGVLAWCRTGFVLGSLSGDS